MRSSRAGLGVLLVTAALLSACSNSPAGHGPLSLSGDVSGGECVRAQPGKWVSAGWLLENHGRSAATIRSVRLPPDAAGIRMTRALIVPNYADPKTRKSALGDAWGFPWPLTVKIVPSWDKRQPAIGAVIRPGGVESVDFGVMRPSAKTARSGGPLIGYTAEGKSFTWQENVSMELATKCF